MRQSEVDGMLAQVRGGEEKVKPKIEFSVGEVVKVADGPFQNQSGVVEEIDPERGKLRVSRQHLRPRHARSTSNTGRSKR